VANPHIAINRTRQSNVKTALTRNFQAYRGKNPPPAF
jgi:hypothetical protein